MWRAIPGLIFLFFCIVLLWVLEDKQTSYVNDEDRLLGQAAPRLFAIAIEGDESLLNFAQPLSKPVFLNFYASWCTPCLAEHPEIIALRKSQPITAIGIGFGDKRENIEAWLKEHGNPFDAVALDNNSMTGIAYGIRGVPESFLIDRKGIVRFSQRGVLTPEDIKEKLIPAIQKYAQ